MTAEQTLVEQIDEAAAAAANEAAGRFVGGRIAAAHPNLPALRWTAHRATGSWVVIGWVSTVERDDDTVRRIVADYAKALGGTAPRMVNVAQQGYFDAITDAEFEGVTVSIWGPLMRRPGDRHDAGASSA